MLILSNRKHKLPSTLIIICLIALLGFKDTGIFVKNYVAIEENQNLTFDKEEKINILKETKDSYIIEKEGKSYEVSKEFLIRTSRSGQKYKVTKITNLFDHSNNKKIKRLSIGETIQALKIESDYGMFETEDGTKGSVKLKDLENIVEESVSYGFAKENKLIKEANSIYALVKGDLVAIKNFKGNSFIVIDDEGNEFKINEDFIELRKIRERTTRGNKAKDSEVMIKQLGSSNNDIIKKSDKYPKLAYSIYSNKLDVNLLEYVLFLQKY